MRRLTRTLLIAGGLLALTPPALADVLDAAGRMLALQQPEARGESAQPPAYWGPVDIARADLEAGRYRRVLWELQTNDADAPLLRAEALLQLGNADGALSELAGIEGVEAMLLRGRVAASVGDFDTARSLTDAGVEAAPDSSIARAQQGQLAEADGDLVGAIAAYGWFQQERLLQRWQVDPDDAAFETADQIVAIASSLDRLATLTADYRRDPSLHDVILSMFVRAYDVIDRGHVDAHAAAAAFLYSRSDFAAAIEELEATLTANPNHVTALRLAGKLNLDRYDFGQAASFAQKLRRIEPSSIAADLLDARNVLLQRQPDQAIPYVERALARQADSIEALGLLAAVHAMQLEDDKADEVLARVDAIDPDDATARFAVGEQLSLRRQYDRAADMLALAVERAPWWTQPRNELGLLYSQAGREADAIATLQEATALDPFNAQTKNYLQLLMEMGTYARIDTDHFAVRYEAESDPLVAGLMADWLDGMHEDVAAIYGWEPENPTEIQVFPTHDRFSVRVAGDPYVGTVGASTGPVIALVTPREGRGTLGTYDWARVMRHEYVHTITLGATGNRIWHWMTEGLAVREEQAPPRQTYLDLLTQATLTGGLFPIEEMTWGFVKPKKATDRSQAYAQSWYACEYIAERWGEEQLTAMIAASGEGQTERQALDSVLQISPEQFDADFAGWMGGKLVEWGRDPAATGKYVNVMRAGESALGQRDWPAAVRAFEEAHQVRPEDEEPMRRLAGLFLHPDINRPADAAEMLMELAIRSADDNRFAKRAARLFMDQDEANKALAAAWLGVRCGPYDREAHQILLDAAEATGDESLAAKQRQRVGLLTGEN